MSVSSDFWKELKKLEQKNVTQSTNPVKTTTTTTPSNGHSYVSSPSKSSGSVSSDFWKNYNKQTEERSYMDVWRELQEEKKKKKEEEEERSWFSKGAFEDGYDIGDVTKTILGTAGDAATGLVKGFTSGLEGIVDLGAYGVAGILDGTGNDDYADILRNVTAQSQTDQIWGGLEETADKYSILGDKADAVIDPITQALGYIGMMYATAGIGAAAGVSGIGATALSTGTMFASSAGGAMGEAYQGGATDEEAFQHGIMKGAVDAGSELIFGGLGKAAKTLGLSRGLSSLDDVFAKALSSKISNHFWRNAVQFGIKASAEGVEEVLAGLGSAVSKKLTYMSDKELSELIKDEKLLEQFAIGTAASAIMQSGFVPGTATGSLKESIATGRDFITGLSQNEQKVVDKVYNDRVAEAEKTGKVSQKEKDKIYDQVLNEMDKGYISIDDIESALGGKTYEDYKRVSEWEDSIQKEYDELHAMKRGDMTGEQIDREAELKKHLEEAKTNGNRDYLKSQLGDEVFGLVKGDRLIESYNERTRRGQAFEADLSQYDTKQQAVLQKAIDSGILNNTNRTHEFVDMLAKISADTGRSFDFVNNEKIAKSSFAVEGKFVNAYVTKDGVTLNIQSPKALNSLVGHEVTHILEGTEFYDTLRETVFNYAISKEGLESFNKRLSDTEALYKGLEADPEGELTADLIGDYLFTDSEFINRLSTENRNVFQKIYDEIKYLCRVATAGSKEARELEKVKKAFEDAYKANGKAQTETKYSISEIIDQNQKSYGTGVHLDSTLLDNLTPDERKVMVKERIKELGGEVFTAYDSNGNAVDITIAKPSASFKNQNGKRRPVNKDLTTKYIGNEVKQEAVVLIDELIATSKYQGTDPAKHTHGWLDNNGQNDWDVWTTYIQDKNNTIWEATLHIANTANGEKVIYDVDPTKKVGQSGNSDTSLHKDNITQSSDNVKYSLSDSDGKQLTKEQQEYFKDSKMRDENGNLKVMYHGSQEAGFHVFDSSKSDDGTSFFFVDSNGVAASYSGTSETYEARTIRTAEDMNNFLAEIGYDHYEAVEKNGKFELLENNEHVATSDTAQGIYEEFCWYEGVGEGDANYKVYLNLKNPLEVDAEGREWNDLPAVDKDTVQYEYIKVVEFGDGGNATIEYAMTGDSAPVTESVDLYEKFPLGLANSLSSIGEGDSLEGADANPVTTRDYAKYAKEHGYDGVIFKNIYDIGGYGGASRRATVAIAFDSNQIKSVANAKPTSDPDIRFSLSKPVEETKDLVAVHNLRGAELIKSLELGGLPMPSIAIIKAQTSHEKYGDVSLIFPKETIDPQFFRANKVYGGDAWTPTYPKIEYKPRESVAKKIREKYYDISRRVGYEETHKMARYVNELEDVLNRAGGEAALVEELYNDRGMMQIYLQDIGKGKVETVNKEIRTELSDAEVEMNEFFIKELGADVVGKISPDGTESPIRHRVRYWEEHGEKIKNAYEKLLREEYGFTEDEIDNVLASTKTADYIRFIRDAHLYRQNGRVTIKTEKDYEATKAAIIQAAGDGYKAWVDELFTGVEEKTGIRNNQNYFDRNGNRRSWNALHWENTLENVVKAMKAQTQTGADAMFAAQQIDAVSAKEYGSIAEIKADSHRLQTIPEEQYEEIRESHQKRFSDIADRIMDKTISNPFTAREIAMESVVDAVRSSKTPTGILNYLKKYSSVKATAKDAADIVALVNDIANMPTGYFEAKPQRAVGFEEVGVFVIPYDADVNLKQELLNRGYSIAEYDPKVEGDRQRVVNQFEDLKFSLSDVGQEHKRYGNWNVYAKDILLDKSDIAPVTEDSSVAAPDVKESLPTAPTVSDSESVRAMFPDDGVDTQEELESLQAEEAELRGVMEAYAGVNDLEAVNKLIPEHEAIQARIRELQQPENDRADSLADSEAPPEMEAPLSMKTENYDPFEGTTVYDINRSTRSYSDRNPGARIFLEEAALGFVSDVNNSTHGERWYNDYLYYESGGEKGFGGTSRHTTSDIAELKDAYGYTWDDLRKAAEDVAKGEFRSVAAKRVEYLCHKRLMEGYTDVDGRRYEPNQDYISFLNETFANEQRVGSIDNLLDNAEQYAPPVEDIAPVKSLEKATPDTMDAPIFESKDPNAVKGQTSLFEAEKPKTSGRVARVLTEESKPKEKSGIGMKVVSALVDKGMVFENLSLDTGNMEVQAKWNSALPANTEKKAQYFMENGAEGVKPHKEIAEEIKEAGEEEFYKYVYHVHNIDRMTLDERFGLENMPVYGDTYTAAESMREVQKLEKAHPEFKAIAEDVYAYFKHLKNLLVEDGCISQELSDWLDEKYPHYVPIRRVDENGKAISVPLDTNKTGVNTPLKRATGGSSDIEPLITTMAMRAEQTFSAIARNRFGIELMNTLGTTVNKQKTDAYEVMDSVGVQEDLLKQGTMGGNPTFTVFENGERVEFEITEDMYDALKPAGKLLGHRSDAITKVSNWRRNLLTTWNPVFALWRNPVKDLQDVMINSQHPAKTYAQLIVPTEDNVIYQIATHGKWAAEYESNGGKGSTYFDSKNKKFKAEDNILKKTIGFPIRAIENAGEFIEEIPRLAEYIASRKEGRSVDRSMLDAARVTTNFAAGGDVTKFANAHGFTFLNASVQGASQHVRNFREATKQDGMKGFVKTLAKYTLAGIPGIILNSMVWDDDEEYEELSDYVKQNYYVVYKTKDGKFFRIPKGRTAAVMQNALEQMQHLITGDDEADFGTLYELFMNNIAPNNPIENNIIAPIMQVKNNRAWYGDDLVPSRLQKLPTEEQFDESTDSLSKWLGENFDPFDLGPYKINYLLDQYSGGLGDMILPMMTPEAESGDNSALGNFLAPWKKEMFTDSVLNNKYPGNFYDLKDELEVVSNGKNATEEDKMRSMYMDSVSWEMGELYAQKREIQSSDLPDDQKYEQVREIQEQINELANDALDSYNDIHIDGKYATVGEKRFDYSDYSKKWYEITGEYLEKEQAAVERYDITPSDYWNNTDLYYKADRYFDDKYATNNREIIAKYVFGGKKFAPYAAELSQIKGEDRDGDGKTDSGSKKENIIEYINGLNLDYGERIIMYRTLYSSEEDRNAYNQDIVDYLNSRDDISYQQMKTILEELGMEVDSEGYITWD